MNGVVDIIIYLAWKKPMVQIEGFTPWMLNTEPTKVKYVKVDKFDLYFELFIKFLLRYFSLNYSNLVSLIAFNGSVVLNTQTRHDAQDKIFKFVGEDSILIGHQLHKDLRVLV